jgi:hypothetical protein
MPPSAFQRNAASHTCGAWNVAKVNRTRRAFRARAG